MEEDLISILTTLQKSNVNMDMLEDASRITSNKKEYLKEIISISSKSEEIGYDKKKAFALLRYYRLANSIAIRR